MVAIDSNALLSHIVSQTRQNVEFLIQQNHISTADGRDILAKLQLPQSSLVSSLIQPTQQLGLNSVPVPQPVPHPPPRSAFPSKPTFQARALWNYNENRQELNDLSFRAGDIIEVIEETNVDWWKGRLNGQEALFPSNYVERLSSGPTHNEKAYQAPVYSSPASAAPIHPQPGYVAPPPNPGYNSYAPPPAPAPAEPAAEPKKSKFGGKLGNTLAHSAVGGVGFGAGSAIGSGIIHSIF